MEDEEPLVPDEDGAEGITEEDERKRRRNIYSKKYRERRREKKALGNIPKDIAKSKGKSPGRYVQRNEYVRERDKMGRFVDSGRSPEEKLARKKELAYIWNKEKRAKMAAAKGMINLSERRNKMAKPSAAGRNPDYHQPLAIAGTSQDFRQDTVSPLANAHILQEPNLKKKLAPGDPGYLPRGPFIYLPADTQQTLLQLARQREQTEIRQKERRAEIKAAKGMIKLSESKTPLDSSKPSSSAQQDKMAKPSAAGRNPDDLQPLAIAGTSQAFRQETVSSPADAPTLQEPNLKNMQVPGDPVYQPRGSLIDLPPTYTVTTTEQSWPQYILHTPNVNTQGYIEDVPPNFGEPSLSNIEPARVIYPEHQGFILDDIAAQQEIPRACSTKPCTSIAKAVRDVMDDMLNIVACGKGKK